ncbi:hypothetical protein POPTR_003G156100v4 [Populus trichocarpa]|uniref:Peroxidase n=1 Tax=Populus trichocarpa TaxID=3694 RepID=B9GYH1_POPTR|nr:peroxidase 7 [Populus trichocarpa]AHL39123.1 class III peroxidase [Populus trichocarpa]KAI5595469.1 hypothetical protein BDE02_03G140800 [Populus trichocarpa]PNT45817.1 hypothetical protein POPTR_003G156100v4 [Populus trichocarpa]|eukprot:XP_002304610.2 peroxidase 7 [Populus trichocarpa]
MKCSFSFGFLLILVLPLILASAQDGKYERAAYHDNYEGAVQKDQDYEGQYQDQEKGPAKYDKNYEKERTPAQNDQHYDQEEQDYHVPSLEISTLLDNLPSDDLLSFGYYSKSCPKAESIINKHVTKWVEEDRTLAASLLRLHFHDCAVHGCDGSILLNHEGSERTSEASKSLRGFEVIDAIKAEMEKECPRTVSCADILTAASRDATVLLGGPYWDVPYGRKDGKVSIDKDAELVPMGRENITTLIEFYQSNGLNVLDLVVLSGAHTIGRATCGSLQYRLYNYAGTGKQDESLDYRYANFLKRKCRWASEYVDLDATTPRTFDNVYYKNLQDKMGLLHTDQSLYSDSRTSPIVDALADAPSDFFNHQFAVSMTKLGNILVPAVQDGGEIRTKCYSVNSNY